MSRDWGLGFSLREINLDIREGEYFVLLGPTAAGKTLLLEMIAGFYAPDQGVIWIGGVEATRLPPEKREVGFVYQDYALFPHLTAGENVEFGLRLRGRPDAREKADRLLEKLGVTYLAKRRIQTLSGGEQQRVAIARALATEPRVLLLDEPLSSLDLKTQEKTRGMLRRVQRDLGVTVVHVTHNQSEAMVLADRIGVIMDGELIQVGPPSEVFTRPLTRKAAEFLGVENILPGRIVSSREGIAVIDLDGTEVQVVTHLKDGPVEVFIRPEEIILSDNPISTSARNLLTSEVVEVNVEGALARVFLERGITALITRRSAEEMEIRPGRRLFATFKATAPHVIPRDGGDV